jgi:hypothetical protein
VKLTLETGGSGIGQVKAGVKTLQKAAVLVGIPEEKGARKKGRISNAQLLFIHSNGSPIRGIPRRPVIEPAVTQSRTETRISKELGLAASSALAGDSAGVHDHLDRAGTIGESASKAWFTNPANGWPPNKLSTVNRKLGKLSDSKREAASDAVIAAGGDLSEVDTPLIDTGQMRRAITHVIEE